MTRVVVGGKEMPSFAAAVRERIHPLHQIRQVAVFRRALAVIDVPVWARVRGVRWKVRVRLVRDVSHLLLRRGPEPQVASLVEAAVEVFRPQVFWDVGAYFGYYGFLVKSLDEDAEIVFCEPDPSNANLIRQTLERAPRGMHLIEAAVAEAAGKATFVSDPISGSTGSLTAAGSAGHSHWGESRQIEVDTVTLDDAIGDGSLDMLKIDVEEHEEEVVHGGLRTFERCRPLVVFECFHGGTEICEFLERLGYEVFDAERLGPRAAETSNFFGLPPQYRGQKEELMREARARLEAK